MVRFESSCGDQDLPNWKIVKRQPIFYFSINQIEDHLRRQEMGMTGQERIMKMLHVDGEYLLNLSRREVRPEVMEEVGHRAEQARSKLSSELSVLS